MKFIVIEIKDKDLFTIYDAENKGVCCCSAYTLKQLLNDHNEVLGCKVVNGKLNVFECDLAGNKRSKKASDCCKDLTKRSASTIEKGLLESKYPRIKTERSTVSVDFEPVMIAGTEVRTNQVKKLEFANENGVSCIILDATQGRTSIDVFSVDSDAGISTIPIKSITAVKSTRLTEDKRKIYDRIAAENLKVVTNQKKYKALREEWSREQAKVNEKYAPKVRNLEETIRTYVESRKNVLHKALMKMDSGYSESMIKDEIEKFVNLSYHYAGDRGYITERGTEPFDVYVSHKGSVLTVSFVATIECRETRDWIIDTIGYEEYDGTVMIDSDDVPQPQAEKEFRHFHCNLNLHPKAYLKKSFFYNSSGETSKGYFGKNFCLTYTFKGLNTVTKEQLKGIIAQIK